MRSIFMVLSFAAALILPGSEIHADPAGPADTVAAFHEALASGEKEKALELLDPSLFIAEDGHAEDSRDHYSTGHMDADIKFLGKAKRKILLQKVNTSGDMAWVITRYETKVKLSGKRVKIVTVETMLLRKTEPGWRIVHIHWSNNVLK